MGLWSLPPSWLSTVLDAVLERSLVAKARSGVVLLSHRLERRLVGRQDRSGEQGHCQPASLLLPLLFGLLLHNPMPLSDC